MVIGRRFRQLLAKRIADERALSPEDVQILSITQFTTDDARRWGHIGEVEVQYSRKGYHAIYGFDALARIQIYMD